MIVISDSQHQNIPDCREASLVCRTCPTQDSEETQKEDISNIKALRKKAIDLLRHCKVEGNSIVFSPFAYDQVQQQWIVKPHFHVVSFGFTLSVLYDHKQEFAGWKVDGTEFTTDETGIVLDYQDMLQAAGIKKGQYAFVWFGTMSYSKLRIPKSGPDYSKCPICSAKLVEIYYDGDSYLDILPGRFANFVDVARWKPVLRDDDSTIARRTERYNRYKICGNTSHNLI